MVFPSERLAVFIDGCFWHGCPLHYKAPSANKSYWRSKVMGNMERDLRVTRELGEQGWYVLRFWEHDDPSSAVDRIALALVGDA